MIIIDTINLNNWQVKNIEFILFHNEGLSIFAVPLS